MGRVSTQLAVLALVIAACSLLTGCATIPLDESQVVLTPYEASTVSSITGPLFDDYSLIVNPTRIRSVALNQDGSLVAAKHEQLTVWDVDDERVVAELSRQDGGRDGDWFGFAPDRPRFAVTTGTALELYDTARETMVRSWPLPAGNWDGISGCMAGDRLWLALRKEFSLKEIVARAPIEDGMLLWSPATGARHSVAVGIGDLVFAADCTTVLTVGPRGGLLYDLTQSPPQQRRWRNHNAHARGGLAAALSPTGRGIVARSNGRIDWIDSFADKLLASFTEPSGGWGVNNPLAFDGRGRLLAYSVEHFGGFNAAPSDLHLLDLGQAAECAILSGHRDSILALAFSGDGQRVATGSRDQSVRIWQVPPSCQPTRRMTRAAD